VTRRDVATVFRARAPVRLDFAGGWTDVPPFSTREGGAVVNACVALHAHAEVRLGGKLIRLVAEDLGQELECANSGGLVLDGRLDLLKAGLRMFPVQSTFTLTTRCDAPAGSGLGSSGALDVALVAALTLARGERLPERDVAEQACYLETVEAGIPGGKQDQFAAAFGGFNLLEFSAGGVRVTPVDVDPPTLERLQEHLVLCYTGSVRRNVGLIDRQIELYRSGREDTVLGMKQLTEMAYAMRQAIEIDDVERLGPMLRDAFESKKRMNPYITERTTIESMLDAASGAGATGGKICGAGGGGYLLIACAPEVRSTVVAELERLGGQAASFSFFPHGVRAQRGDEVWIPDGARP
jgi:D-glycero-alpha-D-manno-heptose-7-phosphate kinase